MSFTTAVTRLSYNGDGVTVNFTVPWLFYANTDLLVLLNGTTQVLGAQYNVAGAGVGSGTITFTTAPPVGTGNVQIILNDPITQTANFVDGTAFPSATMNQALDRSVQISSRLQDQINRSIRAPDGDATPIMLLPPAATRANTNLGFDSNGNISPNVALISGTLSASSIAAFITPPTATEIATGVTVVAPWYPYGNVLRYGIVANNPAAAAANAAIALALFGPVGSTGPTGLFQFPNTTGADVYFFSDMLQFRNGCHLELNHCNLSFTKTGVASDTNNSFIFATTNFTIENGGIVVNYAMVGATNAGNAIGIGGRDVPVAGSPLPTIFDGLLPTPMGNITIRNIQISSNVPGGNGIFCLGGIQNMLLENVWIDGQSQLSQGVYMEFGWANNVSPTNTRQTSHPHNLRFTDVKVSNLTGSTSCAIQTRGAYGLTIDNLYVTNAAACCLHSSGESLFLNPWVGWDDIGSISPSGRMIYIRNLIGRAITNTAVQVNGASSNAGGYLSGLTVPVQNQTEQLYAIIDGIVIDGLAGAGGYGIQSSAGQISVRNGKITNFQRGIVTNTECTMFGIENVTIQNCSSFGIQIGQVISNYSPPRKSTGFVRGCFIAGSGTNGSNSAAIAVGNTDSCVIEDNRFGYEVIHDNIAETTQTNAVTIDSTSFGVSCRNNYVAATTGGAVAYTQIGGSGSQGCEVVHPLGNVITHSGNWELDGVAIDNATDIATASAWINQNYKFLGRKVYDTSNARLMIAQGALATSSWIRADGGVTVTPS